jgi:hypothetical protein
MTRQHRPGRATTASLAALGLTAGLALGCKGGLGGGDTCVSTREYFAAEAWTRVFGAKCITCHGPAGIAEEQNAEFRLLPASYPGFMDANYEAVKANASVAYDGVSALLAKPSNQTMHGGGKILEPGSEEYRIVEELLAQLAEPVECGDEDVSQLEGVVLMTPEQTLRKASLHLVGRLPTAEEAKEVADGGEEALADAIRGMLEEDAFYDRLGDIFNDLLLTDRYTVYTGFAVDLLNEEDFPNAGAWWDGLEGQEDRRFAVNLAAAREPIDLMNYIVRNDRPFKEVLTADYTVVNPFSAELYGVSAEFEDPTDYREFKEAKLAISRDGKKLGIAHAGVLSSPMFLNRFPTTPTNRNRHRARMVYKLFLATDILRIGERPIDPTESLTYVNPTRDDAKCNFCHKQLDPVAGAFQNWDDYDMEKLVPDREWYPEMFAPGFDGEDMPKSEFPNALPWFAKRAADDPRFVIASVHLVYRALTGQEPLTYPADTEHPQYAAQIAAWQAQDALLRRIGDAFVADDYNLKAAVVEVAMSPYFRGLTAEDELDEAGAVKLGAVGTARLSPPELLTEKIAAVTGVRWLRPWDLSDYLRTDYKILYGGIDSDSITQRLGRLNGIMASVGARMANEVSCFTTAYDFSRPADQRALFPKVEPTQTPVAPGDVDAIKANIQYLHERVLGEKLDLADPEIERTYALFLATWTEGAAAVADGQENPWLSWWCQARVDPNTQADLPESERIDTDENYVIRSWMAVVTYLLSDYKFLYE